MRYWATGRRISGKTVNSTAARITPGVLPMPPRMTITTMAMDSMKLNPPGVMNCFEWA